MWDTILGTLSHLLQLTLQSDHILIDRANFRRKKDMYHKGDNQKSLFKRIKADIKDLDFFHIPEVENRCGILYWMGIFIFKRQEVLIVVCLFFQGGDIVAFSKHLCGAATDLTLRCLLRENYNSKQNVESKVQHKVAAILIALCCHHRCKWRSYVSTFLAFSMYNSSCCSFNHLFNGNDIVLFFVQINLL
jgi:tRNA:m4X modification enzyme